MQQFKRGAGRLLLTNFPFLHSRQAGIQQARKYGLAHARGVAYSLDLIRRLWLDRRHAQTVEFAQCDLIHHTCIEQPCGSFMDGFKDR